MFTYIHTHTHTYIFTHTSYIEAIQQFNKLLFLYNYKERERKKNRPASGTLIYTYTLIYLTSTSGMVFLIMSIGFQKCEKYIISKIQNPSNSI